MCGRHMAILNAAKVGTLIKHEMRQSIPRLASLFERHDIK